MKLLVALVLALMPCVAFTAEPEAKDPIDVAMDKAMEKDPSTAGMVQAISEAQEKWDKEMNAAYRKLQKVMTPEEWKALQTSQRAWIAYRDSEVKTLQEIFNRMQGTMWVPVASSKAMEMTKNRALMLRGYLDTISER